MRLALGCLQASCQSGLIEKVPGGSQTANRPHSPDPRACPGAFTEPCLPWGPSRSPPDTSCSFPPQTVARGNRTLGSGRPPFHRPEETQEEIYSWNM